MFSQYLAKQGWNGRPCIVWHESYSGRIGNLGGCIGFNQLGGPVAREPKVHFGRIPTTLEGRVIHGQIDARVIVQLLQHFDLFPAKNLLPASNLDFMQTTVPL
jgi:hypothetical protein